MRYWFSFFSICVVLSLSAAHASHYVVCDNFQMDRANTRSFSPPDPSIAFYLLQKLTPGAADPDLKFIWYVVYDSGRTYVFLSTWDQMAAFSMPYLDRKEYTGQIVTAMIGDEPNIKSVFGAYNPQAEEADHYGLNFIGVPRADSIPIATFRSGGAFEDQYLSQSTCRNLGKQEYETFVAGLKESSETNSDLAADIPPPASSLNREQITEAPHSMLYNEFLDALREAGVSQENLQTAASGATLAIATLAIIRALTVRRGMVLLTIPPVTSVPNGILDSLTRSEWNDVKIFLEAGQDLRVKMLLDPKFRATLDRLIDALRLHRNYIFAEIA